MGKKWARLLLSKKPSIFYLVGQWSDRKSEGISVDRKLENKLK